MPKLIRQDLDLSQGHRACCVWEPMKPESGGSESVLVETKQAFVVGAVYSTVSCYCKPTKKTLTHDGSKAVVGSPTILINNKAAHRDGDAISCGDVADNGADTVFCDGNPPPAGNKVGYTVGPTRFTSKPLLVPFTYEMIRSFDPRNYPGGYKPRFVSAPWVDIGWGGYTTLVEEDTKKEYPNYPPSPYPPGPNGQRGALLPATAAPWFKKPIPLIADKAPTPVDEKVDIFPKGLKWKQDTASQYYTGLSGRLSGLPVPRPRPSQPISQFKMRMWSDLRGVPGITEAKIEGMFVDGNTTLEYKPHCTNCRALQMGTGWFGESLP